MIIYKLKVQGPNMTLENVLSDPQVDILTVKINLLLYILFKNWANLIQCTLLMTIGQPWSQEKLRFFFHIFLFWCGKSNRECQVRPKKFLNLQLRKEVSLEYWLQLPLCLIYIFFILAPFCICFWQPWFRRGYNKQKQTKTQNRKSWINCICNQNTMQLSVQQSPRNELLYA